MLLTDSLTLDVPGDIALQSAPLHQKHSLQELRRPEKNHTLYIFKLPHAMNDEDLGKNANGYTTAASERRVLLLVCISILVVIFDSNCSLQSFLFHPSYVVSGDNNIGLP